METQEQLFIRVVESGSLKGAAEQLNTDPSTVSRKIAALEKHLGVRLLQRSTSRSTPTEAGIEYYQGLKKILDEKHALEASISSQKENPSGTLCVTAPVDFGAHFVVPVLKKMQQIYPSLNVELILGSQYEDICSKGIDVAIRIGKLPDSNLICRKLGEVSRVLVASKNYLIENGTPQTVNDLESHNFIFYSRNQSRSLLELISEGRCESVKVNGSFTVNSVTAVKNLVLESVGIHLGPRWFFHEEIRNGDLEVLLPEYTLQAYPLHALYSSASYVPAKVRKFIDLMVKQHFDFN
ncbi:MAG: LysR family transcriptional regulator [Pseudoalteromonas prydzensis]|uniref:LysR family transcriptional regulator n=1 Tax=Pseudoalteromonas prydzensis TaxID=182141 RepID=UPI003F981AF2